MTKMDEKCKNCGHTYGAHCANGYYSEFYKRYIPRNCCPTDEGRMNWDDNETTFEPIEGGD